jgi:hypothetical protein
MRALDAVALLTKKYLATMKRGQRGGDIFLSSIRTLINDTSLKLVEKSLDKFLMSLYHKENN